MCSRSSFNCNLYFYGIKGLNKINRHYFMDVRERLLEITIVYNKIVKSVFINLELSMSVNGASSKQKKAICLF